MGRKIIAITHDPDDGQNRCTLWLRANGYEVAAVCPAVGEAIPSLDGEVAGAVVFGGKYDVKQQEAHPFLEDELRFIGEVLNRDLPFLGICLGGQLLAHHLGQDVGAHPGGFAEYGYYDLLPSPQGRPLFGDALKVLQSHWHGWYGTPRGAQHLASTANFPEQAFAYGKAYGLQFHPEATLAMLERWIGRRPAERYQLKGTFLPDRQRADFAAYDAALGRWFHGFLERWIGPAVPALEAAQ